MKKKIKIIDENSFENFTDYRYGGGVKLELGDEIISGYTIMYANLYGHPPSNINPNDVGLSLQMFVLNKNDGMIYQLYKLK